MAKKAAGAALTPMAIAVLALLEERPMHPYEMYQLLRTRREDHLIKIRPGSLYHTVDRLTQHDFAAAEGTDRAGNRPERTIYRITDAGRAALRGQVTELLRQPLREYPIFPVALAESHNLPREQVLAALRERIARLDGDIAELDALRDWVCHRSVPRRYWMVLDYLRAQRATEVGWLRDFVAELESGELTWEAFDPETGERLPDPDERLGHDWAASISEDIFDEVRKGGDSSPTP
ncbi:PadR family transcriptional regulator [Nocardia otitidiscaviarum]|uniref:PadR family transcriptional regulator n=1 Tax=Nocardia otitidiscaviarum TaxID=1823 RepID=UPI000A7A067D|nr:PadR family transcriptional regulator [Nocardia otitidiscaviarum]